MNSIISYTTQLVVVQKEASQKYLVDVSILLSYRFLNAYYLLLAPNDRGKCDVGNQVCSVIVSVIIVTGFLLFQPLTSSQQVSRRALDSGWNGWNAVPPTAGIVRFIDGASCEPDFGGTWDDSIDTCTLNHGFTVNRDFGDVMISSGVTTVLPPFQTISVDEIFSALIIRGGNLIINNGARLTITGTLSVDPGGYLNLIDNDVIITNDIDISIVGPGRLKINGGSLSIGNDGALAVGQGGGFVVRTNSSLKINGGGQIFIEPAAFLSVFDSMVNHQGSLMLMNNAQANLGGTVNINGGSLSVGPSAHLQLVSGILNINNGGVVGIRLGELRIGDSDGILNINNGGYLNLIIGDLLIDSGNNLNINRGGRFTNSGNILNEGTLLNCGTFNNIGTFSGNPVKGNFLSVLCRQRG